MLPWKQVGIVGVGEGGGTGEGGGAVSKETKVSFFASGPFPTCYQMSWSSSGGASKSSRLRAATGATNVRKPNPAARAGRFSPRPQTDGELDNLFSV